MYKYSLTSYSNSVTHPSVSTLLIYEHHHKKTLRCVPVLLTYIKLIENNILISYKYDSIKLYVIMKWNCVYVNTCEETKYFFQISFILDFMCVSFTNLEVFRVLQVKEYIILNFNFLNVSSRELNNIFD